MVSSTQTLKVIVVQLLMAKIAILATTSCPWKPAWFAAVQGSQADLEHTLLVYLAQLTYALTYFAHAPVH